MNWKYLLISAVLLIIAILYSKYLLHEQRVAKDKDDGSGPTISNLVQLWGLVVVAVIVSIICFFSGIFNL